MSYELHKTGDEILKDLKVAHEKFTLEWQLNTTYRQVWGTQMACLAFGDWMHEQSSYSVQMKASKRLGAIN